MSVRKRKRQLDRWYRYFRKYEPWHLGTPGLERAYNAWVHATYAELNKRLRADGANWRAGWR